MGTRERLAHGDVLGHVHFIAPHHYPLSHLTLKPMHITWSTFLNRNKKTLHDLTVMSQTKSCLRKHAITPKLDSSPIDFLRNSDPESHTRLALDRINNNLQVLINRLICRELTRHAEEICRAWGIVPIDVVGNKIPHSVDIQLIGSAGQAQKSPITCWEKQFELAAPGVSRYVVELDECVDVEAGGCWTSAHDGRVLPGYEVRAVNA